jgi:tRNA/tmRNA/rRNA uracil-C5-methylase (TrmA/RlmC/RlmD family)
MAVDKLKKLVEDERISPSVRLGAINSILDRTGYQTTHKVEDVTGKKSDEELESELKHLLSAISVDKMDVN